MIEWLRRQAEDAEGTPLEMFLIGFAAGFAAALCGLALGWLLFEMFGRTGG